MSRQEELDERRGRALVGARTRAGMQQKAAAASVGVTRGTMRRWERGYWIDREDLERLALLYRVKIEQLLGGIDDLNATTPGHVLSGWPQWARERWAEVQLELVRDGIDDETLTLLRTFVLAPHLLAMRHPEALLRQDVEAGVAAARAWSAARRAMGAP